jgi:hypothetical protein
MVGSFRGSAEHQKVPENDPDTVGGAVHCAECRTVLDGSRERVVTEGGTFCRACFDRLTAHLQQAFAAQGEGIAYPAAAVGGLLGGAAGSLVWWGFTVLTKISFGLVAVVIGVAVGRGILFASGNRRHLNLQILSAVIATLSFFYATFLVNRTFLARAYEKMGQSLSVPLVPGPAFFLRVVSAHFDVMQFVFLAIVVFEAWRIPAPVRFVPRQPA